MSRPDKGRASAAAPRLDDKGPQCRCRACVKFYAPAAAAPTAPPQPLPTLGKPARREFLMACAQVLVEAVGVVMVIGALAVVGAVVFVGWSA